MNNYRQINYNAKGTAAASTADKPLSGRGDSDGRRARLRSGTGGCVVG